MHRSARALVFVLAAAAVRVAIAAEPPPAADWRVAIDSGMRVATTLSVLNQCHAAHRFALDADTAALRWLQIDPATDFALAPGAAAPLPAAIDARTLDPGQQGGTLTLRCLDCVAEPGCAAQRVAARLSVRWPPQALTDTSTYAPDSLLMLPAADAGDTAALAAELGLRVRRTLILGSLAETWLEVEPLVPLPIADLIARIETDPRLRAVQPNFVFQTAADDPMRPLQYALHQMRIDPARRGGGRGVVLAIIDTGIDIAHPELEQAAWTRSDWVGDAGASAEPHGTLVAGLIAAQVGNPIGIAGIAARATLLAARACRSRDGEAAGLCASAALVLAIDWAMGKGARVINLSLAGPRDPLLLRLLRVAMTRRAVVVAAAGNRGPDAPPLYPAAEPGVIAVSAVDAAGRPYAQGASGAHIGVAAPGVEVLSTWPGGEFRSATGTSFAAAQVSALIALLLELQPTLDSTAVRRAIDAALQPASPPAAGIIDACRLLGEPC